VIYTSNWHDVLRRAFEEAGETAREVYFPQRAISEIQIVKVCRSFSDKEGIRVTTGDYELERERLREGKDELWQYLESELDEFSFIFVGFSLDDPEFDLIRPMLKQQYRYASEEPRHFLVSALGAEEARMARKCAGVSPVSLRPSEFFQELVHTLEGEE
jgi:hypothetical protein